MTFFTVPNLFNHGVDEVEQFYRLLDAVPRTSQVVFDLGQIDFIRPYGLVALTTAIRHLAAQTRKPVLLLNLSDQVYLYLHRMDFFQISANWCKPDKIVASGGWSRDPATMNLLEMSPIGSADDVARVMERTERIFSRWLLIPNLRSLLNVLSELCANIYQHSADPTGYALIQKYNSVKRERVTVRLAVGDAGRGIRGSLAERHPDIGTQPLDYLLAAMNGRTARNSGRGGLGLRLVEQIVGSEGGQLWLRSETAAILSHGSGTAQGFSNLANLPGTQIAVEFYAPLPTAIPPQSATGIH